MEKVGEIFKRSREERGLTIAQVAKGIKVSADFLVAIENNNYEKLPIGLYPELYIRKYAKFLNLSEEKMVAFFRRDNLCLKDDFSKKRSCLFPMNFNWSRIIGFGLLSFFFGGYLLFQYLNFVRPPKIKTFLKKGENGEIIIKGESDPRAVVRINGEIIKLDKNGKFTFEVKEVDKREALIIAESPSGKVRELVEKW